ncbi:MAG: ABC transporter substrate-binding protein [Prochlorococcaceae cyanobacterium]
MGRPPQPATLGPSAAGPHRPPPQRLLPALLALLLTGSTLTACSRRGAAPDEGAPAPAAGRASSREGEPPREWRLGQSAPLTGPSAQLGREYREGALAWFEAVNRRGGIHGRPVRLISLDDRYEPALTQRNTARLIDGERVFALFGYVGTPTTLAALPLVDRHRTPLIAPLSGAAVLREPQRPWLVHLRSSYQQETDRLVNALVRSGRQRVAVLHQADAFGDDGLRAARRALGRHGLRPVATASVPRNSSQAGAAARRLLAAQPSAVLMVTAYPGAAGFRRELQRLGAQVQLMSLSFVGTRALQEALPGGGANGIGISQVVPFPWDRRLPVVADYQRLMARRQHRPRYGFTSLEGFLAARLVSEGLERAGPGAGPEDLLRALRELRALDLGGFRIRLGPGDSQASDFVDLTYLGAQGWEP